MNQIKFKFKVKDGQLVIKESKKLQRDLKQLQEEVEYEGLLRAIDQEVVRVKKAYFAMESDLAKHLGETKDELHKVLAKSGKIGMMMDAETGKPRYKSMSEVYEKEEVIERMHELAQFAIEVCDYKFPPILPNGTTGLQLNTAALE
jgi:hypothetical protein